MSGMRDDDTGHGAVGGAVPVDAHAHLYPGFDIERTLDSAARHFATARRELGYPHAGGGVLLLADPPADPPEGAGFGRMARTAGSGARRGRWRIRRVDDLTVRAVRSGDGGVIDVIAGRQVRTREGLEVLALAGRAAIPGGEPARATLLAIRDAGAVPVIPWGFGKWLGRRGAIVDRLVREGSAPRFFLGDSGGRPELGPEPGLFRRARRGGVAILPGSDPLPFPGQERKVGRRGFFLPGGYDAGDPGRSVAERLRRLSLQPGTYGNGERILPFVALQIGMQARKLLPGGLR